MAFFAGPAVKELKKQASFIGGLYGQAFIGQIGDADRDDVVGNADFRRNLRSAWEAAAAEAGEQKATTAAMSAAKVNAESFARLGNRPYGDVLKRASEAVRQMIGC